MDIKTTKRKGVNLQEFLAKVEIAKKETPPKEKPVLPIISEKRQIKNPSIRGEKILSKHSENSEKSEENLFKFIDANRIVEKDKLLSFIKWFGVPREIRRIKTQSEFASTFGVSIDTLTSWKKLAGFYNEVEVYHFNEMKRFMADVGYGIVKAAKKGNPRAQELYFKMYLNWNEKLKVEDTTLPHIITEEQRAKIEFALKNIGLATIIEHDHEGEDDNSEIE